MPGGILSFLIFFPIFAGIFIGIGSASNAIKKRIKFFALLFTLIEMLLSILLYFNYDKENGGFQFIDYFDAWIPFETFRAQYLVGIDGLSAPLVLLTGILGFCAVIASLKISFREREYFMWLLILQGVVTGVFSSLDMLLLFVFWEAELIPMYFLISIWGSGKAQYSAMKFLIFTLTSGAFFLIGILSVYFATGTFVMYDITELNLVGVAAQLLIFSFLNINFLNFLYWFCN